MGIFFSKNDKEVSLGRKGEKIASSFLKKNGYKILKRNFQNKQGYKIGEIDIIAKEGEEIVFCEVKTRKHMSYALPEENINRRKLDKMKKISEKYIKDNDLWNSPYRFDAISILVDEDGHEKELKHIKNIFI